MVFRPLELSKVGPYQGGCVGFGEWVDAKGQPRSANGCYRRRLPPALALAQRTFAIAESLARAARLNLLLFDTRRRPRSDVILVYPAARLFRRVRFLPSRYDGATLTKRSNSTPKASILCRNATAFLRSRIVKLVNGFVVINPAPTLSEESSQAVEHRTCLAGIEWRSRKLLSVLVMGNRYKNRFR